MGYLIDVTITPGDDPGPYSIYYNTINVNNLTIDTLFSVYATNISYTRLTTGTGVNIWAPTSATTIILYNEICLNSQTFII